MNTGVAQLSYKLIHERRIAKEVSAELDFGRLQVTYSNKALASVTEFVVGIKDQPSFRDLDLIPDCLLPKGTAQISTQDQSSEQRKQDKDRSLRL